MGQAVNCEPEAQKPCDCKNSRKFRELLEKHLLTIITLTGVISGLVLGMYWRICIIAQCCRIIAENSKVRWFSKNTNDNDLGWKNST